mmetsp:Transcript_114754/g.358890  ORF Transcript_114754/g.358890 Transcript_114754/m.358890 type:complete len:754 (-) Transcript_114754:76-2337(-)
MPPLSYAKWDHLDDSDSEDGGGGTSVPARSWGQARSATSPVKSSSMAAAEAEGQATSDARPVLVSGHKAARHPSAEGQPALASESTAQGTAAALLAQAQELQAQVEKKPRVATDILEVLGQLSERLDSAALESWEAACSSGAGKPASAALLAQRVANAREERGALQQCCMTLARALRAVSATLEGLGTPECKVGEIGLHLKQALPLHVSQLYSCIATGQSSLSGACAVGGATKMVSKGKGRGKRASDAKAKPPAHVTVDAGGMAAVHNGIIAGIPKIGRPCAATRPPARFAPFLADGLGGGGVSLPELDGPNGEAEAKRLVAASIPFIWRRAALVSPLEAWGTAELIGALNKQKIDTNLSCRADRKFVYFSPSRLEKGVYEPDAIAHAFLPMRLNEQMTLEEVCQVHSTQAPDAARPGGSIRCDEATGWARAAPLAKGAESPYVMQVLLEGLSPEEERKVARLPQQMRPPTARLAALHGCPAAIWRPDLTLLSSRLMREASWAHIGSLAQAGGWGGFQTAGLMVSGRDALTPLHYDKHHNVFCQLQGAKRFLLLEARQTPHLYGFPTLHALDPLSRVDLELCQEELCRCWPRALEARGMAVTLEAGDALVLPQGTWHHVHSLEVENVSVNFLFALGEGEACGGDGLRVNVGSLPAARRPAALAELAKTAEGLVGSLVGNAQAAAALRAAHAVATSRRDDAAGGWAVAVAQLQRFLRERLGDGQGGAPVMEPEDYVRAYLDPRRFDGLPLRRAL